MVQVLMALVAGGLGAAVLAAGLFVHRNQRLRTTARASGVQEPSSREVADGGAGSMGG